ncbi:Uncharacterized protein K3495_g11778 [Podosphaera aphanis]|nr:Uncharacterized protein K3495_g11778 [Podosphaera aphanis]
MDQPTENVPNTSLSSLLATLAPTLLISLVYVTIFFYLRKSQRRFYAPRTYIGTLNKWEHTETLPNGFFNWIPAFCKIPDTSVLQRQSLDAYLFLRFLKVTVLVTFIGALITWPILLPVYITGGNGNGQLDMFSIGNINLSGNGPYRYYASTFAACLFFIFVLSLVTREIIFYVNLRQAFFSSPFFANRISSRTVLFTCVPTEYQDEGKLRKIFGSSVKRVWITRETTNIDKLVEERDQVAYSLEAAELKLLKLANSERLKKISKSSSTQQDSQNETATEVDVETGSLVSRWVPEKKRPTHKLGLFGILGQKVDTINWSRRRLETLIPATKAAQVAYHEGDFVKNGSIFIEFAHQSDAQSAFQVLTHHQALHMSPRYIGISPSEIIWPSLSITWWQRVVRGLLATGIVSALIIFWAIPVGFVGLVSNVNYLKNYSALTWLDKIPDTIMGIITGLLPSVALAILMSLVPVIIRVLAKFSGEPSLAHVELYTQKLYFIFQVVQVFLVATVASAATALIKQAIDDPSSITSVLATKIPRASNFYISYFIVQGLTVASGVISQVVGFIIFRLFYKYLAGTPRSMYQKWTTLSSISWGSTLPVFTNIAVIAITYSCIAPLILGFATIGMSLFYLAYRYNILFVSESLIDTKGLIYPTALRQLLTGVYLSEVCLIGLFAISRAPGPIILMVIFFILTIVYHRCLNFAIDPLLQSLPMTLLVAEEPLNEQAGLERSDASEKKASIPNLENGLVPAKTKHSLLAKFIAPHIYSDHATLRKLLPPSDVDSDISYKNSVADEAYLPPSVTSQAPLLWIPKDKIGISSVEISETKSVILMTDEFSTIDDKNKIIWDQEVSQSPLWQPKIYY